MKLLIRGGSIAAGYGVARGYADILKDTLTTHEIQVINRSRYRETSFEGIETFNEDIAAFAPDILLLHFGVDDAFGYVYRSEFQENIVQIIRRARTLFHPLIFLATAHTFDNTHDMAAVDIFYRSVRLVAVDLNCKFISLDRYWAGYLAKNGLESADLVLSDPRYPNEKGHEVFAQAIMKALYRALPALTK
ncbi:MAG TPA: SGNH/GDSL hydrolase family protein [Smithellaceae bacterium]|nr:SGNH/GDSL hydrolase family protein [Smithellaceae bacterium]